ncbi:hypothetical protein D3C87_1753620 [compost metagenome]
MPGPCPEYITGNHQIGGGQRRNPIGGISFKPGLADGYILDRNRSYASEDYPLIATEEHAILDHKTVDIVQEQAVGHIGKGHPLEDTILVDIGSVELKTC